MTSQIEEIKSRIDIVELVGSYLRLSKAGANFRALCPFHREKTPSFNVSPSRQIWHCFGCGKGGDVLSFLQEIDGVEFVEALKTLATRAGVELRDEDPQIRSERNRQFALLEEAAKFFEGNLVSNSRQESNAPLNYLCQRGLADETIKEFRLGYAPDEWKSLFNHLMSKGFKADEIERAGLAVNYVDRFRGRIIFPIFDYGGRVIAFGGRIWPEKADLAKYINSPETALYQKGRTVYGLHKAKSEILREGLCVMVEGYIDLIMSHQAGVRNAVAVSGTALTEDQLKVLRRLCDKLIIAFDMDLAGESAAKRGIDLALANGFDVKVAVLSGVKDPAEAVEKNPEIWTASIKNAAHIVDFYISAAIKRFDPKTPEAKKEFQRTVLPILASVAELEQAHWAKRIADILNIQETSVWEALNKLKIQLRRAIPNYNKEVGTSTESSKNPRSRKELLEMRILSVLAKFPVLQEKLDPAVRRILPQENFAAVFAELFLSGVSEAEIELASCQRELKKEHLKERMRALSLEMSKKEKSGASGIDMLAEEFKKITVEFTKLN